MFLYLVFRTVVFGIISAAFIINIFYLYLEYTFIREKQEDFNTMVRHNHEDNKTLLKMHEALSDRLKVIYAVVFSRSFMLLLAFIGIITL